MEGEIDRGIARHRIPSSRAPISVASRTDRGVSAVGNALTLTSELDGPTLLRALNGLAPEIFFTAVSEAPAAFAVRRATRRVYRYFDPTVPVELDRWQDAAQRCAGRIDVRSFGRGLPAGAPQWRSVEYVRIDPGPAGLVVEVAAPSFVWGMVRKIVGALRLVGAGQLPLAEFESALAGRERLTLPMAEPEPLVLWDVEFPLAWQHRWPGPNRHQARWWAAARARTAVRQRVLDVLGTAPGASDRGAAR